jgi:serine/threonine-protein kinase
MFKAGDRIGMYEIIAPIKAGGMGTLFLARKTGAASFVRPVAIKVLHAHLSKDEDLVRAFVDEALLASRISHPHVIHVEELGQKDGAYFLVMEYIDGVSLAELMAALHRRGRGLSPEVAVAIAVRVAEGLHAAHEMRDERGKLVELVHRDVSPQNVLISAGGNVKVIDFGIAKAYTRAGIDTQSATLKGKIPYMSPEQARGKSLDRRSDVYALGIVLWEMLTGRRAFSETDAFRLLEEVRAPSIPPTSSLLARIPAKLDAEVMRALSIDREGRPADARMLAEALLDALPTARRIDAPKLSELVNDVLGDVLKRQEARLSTAPAPVSHARFSRGEVVYESLENLERDLSPFVEQGIVCAEGDAFPQPLEDFDFVLRLPGGRSLVLSGQIVSLKDRVALIRITAEPHRLIEAARAAVNERDRA